MSRFSEFIRRSFSEFLAVPTAVILGFIGLAILMNWVDRSDLPFLRAIRVSMGSLVFTDAQATATLLGTIAGSLVTLTSITLSILLLAVQQAAASMTHAVIDQFLRRSANQVFFGFFLGLALYALIILAATGEGFNPVLAATLALLLTILALYLLIVLIYSTIHQMRPADVAEAIHDHALLAREHQRRLMARTRRRPAIEQLGAQVVAKENGFVIDVDLDRLAAVVTDSAAGEIVVEATIGTYVSFGDPLIDLRGASIGPDAEDAIRGAFKLDRSRDLAADPAYGIEQLVNIAWTSISTSKQNVAPGRLVVLSLRDLIARWTSDQRTISVSQDEEVPIVYPDTLLTDALDAMELLAVVSSESMQVQNLALTIESLAILHPRLPVVHQQRVVQVSMSTLAGLGDHVLTGPLDDALKGLEAALSATHPSEATAIREARTTLARSNGTLKSRSTRVPQA